MTEYNPELRASDADRDRAGRSLQEHFADGRLDNEEFNERLQSAYNARTLGQLTKLTHDLPEQDLSRFSKVYEPVGQRAAGFGGGFRHPGVMVPWVAWAAVSTLNFVVWLILILTVSSDIYPWWVWVAGPWGVINLVTTFVTLYVERYRGDGEAARS